MRLPITAYSVRCALGDGVDAVAEALVAGRSGLVHLGDEPGLLAGTWYGHAGSLAPAPSRQEALVRAVVAPLLPAIDAARRRWGADRVGVAIGTTTGGIGETERHHAAWKATGLFPGELDAAAWLRQTHNLHVTAELVAALAGVGGPAIVQSSACASSAKVLATAARWIGLGVVDAVICGGVDSFCRYTLLGFGGLGILSSQRTRPFAAARDGINLGEAGALLLLEREGLARGWLRGVGETSDAFHLTQPHPEGAGLAEAMRRALVGVDPASVQLVNAHATGTPANDAAEAQAIAAVLPHRPWVTATKPLTGHTLGAAGGLEAVLTLISLERGFVPAVRTEAPLDACADPLRLALETVHAPLRMALSTSAAFAGHNAAVLLEAP